MASETDIAWAAGLFDGEGSIGIYWHPNRTSRMVGQWTLNLSLAMTDEACVNLFHEIVVEGHKCKRHRPDPKHKLQFGWKTAAAKAEAAQCLG